MNTEIMEIVGGAEAMSQDDDGDLEDLIAQSIEGFAAPQLTVPTPETSGVKMTMTEDNTETKDGRVLAIAGPVVDVEFPRRIAAEINTFTEMDAELEGAKVTIGGEVAQQIGEGKVRVVCMKATDFRLRRRVRNTGRGIAVHLFNVLGHIFNVLGEPLTPMTLAKCLKDGRFIAMHPTLTPLSRRRLNRYQSDRPS